MVGNLFLAGIQWKKLHLINVHAPSESFVEVGQLERKLVSKATQVQFLVSQKLLISKKFKFCWVHKNAVRVWRFCKFTPAVKEGLTWVGGFQVNSQIVVKRDET